MRHSLSLSLSCVIFLTFAGLSPVGGQTLREAFGTNSRRQDPVDQQNRYPRIREFHLWVDDQGYDSNTVPNWPANPFTFGPTDTYYPRLAGEIVQTAYGIPGEMRGLMNISSPPLDWLIQKPFLPVNGPGAVAPNPLGYTKLYPNPNYNPNLPNSPSNPVELYFGDWLAAQAPTQDEPRHWLLKAHWMTVLADRYGLGYGTTTTANTLRSRLHRPSTASTAPYVNHSTAAAGQVQWFEAENEPDRTWLDPAINGQVILNSPRTMWQTAPAMLAAQTSMVYDGHGASDWSFWPYGASTSNGVKVGVKSVSSANKVAIAGLAGLRGRYITDMVDWFVLRRVTGVNGYGYMSGPKLPFDAISFHHYPSNDYRNPRPESGRLPATEMEDRDAEYSQSTRLQWDTQNPNASAESPEEHLLRDRVAYTIKTVYDHVWNKDANVYGEMAVKEVWLSEFGYDSDNEPPGVPIPGTVCFNPTTGVQEFCKTSGGIQIPNLPWVVQPSVFLNKEVVQAQWLSRSYLELMAVHATIPSLGGNTVKNLDKFFQYEMRDLSDKPDDASGRSPFASSGLLRKDGSPKASHFYTMALLHHLGDYRHEVATGNVSDPRRRYTIPSIVTVVTNSTPKPSTTAEAPMLYRFMLPSTTGTTAASARTNRYTLWSPTKQGYDYEVELNINNLYPTFEGVAPPTVITVHRLSNFSNRGVATEYAVVGGIARFKVGSSTERLRVSETPQIIQAGPKPANTNVSAVRSFFFSDFCCGDLEARWGRQTTSGLTTSFTVAYIKKSQVTGSMIDPTKLTIVATDITRTSQVIPGLEVGTEYYIVILPANQAGYVLDVDGGISIPTNAGTLLTPETNGGGSYVYLVKPQGCTQGGDCIYPVTSAMVSSAAPNLGAVDAAAILNGANLSSVPKCSSTSASVSWSYTGPIQEYFMELTFPNAINISRVKVFQNGVDPNAAFPGMEIQYKTCDCPEWKTLVTHSNSTPFSWSTYVSAASKVTKMRFRKGAINIGAIHLCATASTCLEPAFAEASKTSVEAVEFTSARVSWSPAIDTVSGDAAEGYDIVYGKALDRQGKITDPQKVKVAVGKTGERTLKLENLEPGTTYYGLAGPDPNPCGIDNYPAAKFSEPATDGPYYFSTKNPSAFTFTTPSEKSGTQQLRLVPPVTLVESSVAPNPARSELTIAANRPVLEVQVRDVQGRSLLTLSGADQLEVRVDVGSLPAGLYYVTVKTAEVSQVHSVVIAK